MKYILDTNTVSHLLKKHPEVKQRIQSKPISSMYISSITEAELHFGLAKRPNALKLHQLVHEFLIRVKVLSWDSDTAKCYGLLRANIQQQGKALAPLDLLIATHALQYKATLITNDKAFRQIETLKIEDWLEPLPKD